MSDAARPTLAFDSVYEALPTNGWLSRPEALLLWNTASDTTGAILEVGSYFGRSTCLLAALAASQKRLVYAVDPLDGFDSDLSGDQLEALLTHNICSRDLQGSVQFFRQRIEDWPTRLVGMAYLDGDHTYQGTLDQLYQALRCDPQAVAIHDVNDRGGGAEVKRAALRVLGDWGARAERLAVWRLK